MQKRNSTIKLNFLPLQQQDYDFVIYRKTASTSESRPDDNVHFYRLPVSDDGDEYADYWISFSPYIDYEEFSCKAHFNSRLSIQHLYNELIKACHNMDNRLDIEKAKYYQELYFILAKFDEGCQAICIQPWYLPKEREIGILVDFCFKCSDSHSGLVNNRILQLSLSLDKDNRRNKNHYLDRYSKIVDFIKKILPQINHNLVYPISSELKDTPSSHLAVKEYVFADQKTSNSQYKGIQAYGPLSNPHSQCEFLFVFQESEVDYARELFMALDGRLARHTFPGMTNLFKIPFTKDNVKHKKVGQFTEVNINDVFQESKVRSNGISCLPIFVLPNKTDGFYSLIKELSATSKIPCQVVTVDLIRSRNALRWSASNIGLQIFAKLGGAPWKVVPSNEKCLIIGLGQAHRRDKAGQIKKYLSYSILMNSSGLFKDIKVTSNTIDCGQYLEDMRQSIRKVVNENCEYDKYVLHTPFKIRRSVLKVIKNELNNLVESQKEDRQFCVLKVNTKNRFFGFSPDMNSLVPYESTCVQLSSSQFLVWFEGLQYGDEVVKKMISGPTHVDIIYSSADLDYPDKMKYLQDLLNLSGANWRGFNAKSLPVSIYYCELVARFLRDFPHLQKDAINFDNIKPWFL